MALADSLALRYAPALSFAPGERFFPTIPFFTALDGDSGIGDPTKADFADPWEVAPYIKHPGTDLPVDTLLPLDSAPVAWKELLKAYHPDAGTTGLRTPADYSIEHALKRVVVLYRVCSLSKNQNRNLERFLKSDEQAFERFQDTRSLDSIVGPDPQFDVIQYFLYYLADRGLQGHPNDIELVSVFFPAISSDQPATLNLRERFRIVVGSGHSPRTPNNVLVLSAFHRGESKLAGRAFVLVELGGHSSAPDLPPIGRFTPGLDANWHAYNLWGTRDAQAVGGVGYLGQYAQAMTFERGLNSDGIYVFPPTYGAVDVREAEEDIKGTADQYAPSQRSDTSSRQPRAAPQRPDSALQQADTARIYRLLPMHLLIDLDSALDDTANTGGIVSAVSMLQKRLCPPRDGKPGCNNLDSVTWNSARFDLLDSATQRNAIQAMRRWKVGMIRDTLYMPFEPRNQNRPGLPRIVELLSRTSADPLDPRSHRPWEHRSFMGKSGRSDTLHGDADPTEVLKAHLFRPNTYTAGMDGGLRNLVLFGAKVAPTDGWELYTGIVLPAFRSQGLPVRFGGFLELQAGINCRQWGCGVASPTFGILYEAHRNSIVSWYVAGNWVPKRPQVTATPGAGEFAVSGGVSLLPMISDNIFSFINVIRLRGGVRFDPLQGKDLLGRVRWELNLAIRQ